jgi:hypothetical protein
MSKVMTNLKFSYLLKYDLFVCDNSFFFPFDLFSLMRLVKVLNCYVEIGNV